MKNLCNLQSSISVHSFTTFYWKTIQIINMAETLLVSCMTLDASNQPDHSKQMQSKLLLECTTWLQLSSQLNLKSAIPFSKFLSFFSFFFNNQNTPINQHWVIESTISAGIQNRDCVPFTGTILPNIHSNQLDHPSRFGWVVSLQLKTGNNIIQWKIFSTRSSLKKTEKIFQRVLNIMPLISSIYKIPVIQRDVNRYNGSYTATLAFRNLGHHINM